MPHVIAEVTLEFLQAFADAWNHHDLDALMTLAARRPLGAGWLGSLGRRGEAPWRRWGRLECVARRCCMSLPEAARVQARMADLHEHIQCENRHDLDAAMATFRLHAPYDYEPWRDYPPGRHGDRAY